MERRQPKLDQSHTKDRFKGRVAVVTGGASGIGKECVKRFINDGASVAFLDTNQEAGQLLEAELKAAGHDAIFYHIDVSDRDACFGAAKDIAGKHGGCIHAVVNCAASFLFRALDASMSDWETIMGVNVAGSSNVVQACYPFMKNEGPETRAVVNIASVSAHCSQKQHWTYNSSKGAILQLTKCMALDLIKDGIRVNSVSPGIINTPALDAIVGSDEIQRAFYGSTHMMNRNGECSEIAAAIVFLCSRDASFITGADLSVDGGYTAMGPERHGQEGPNFTAAIPE
ncbi:uncharacterized protein LOC106169864 [Lingula anatina]|uniref:Uncharacterized protein LOC106169864 n=1 Tax=Lingula anatina TaxID=7574 RepID=A0A1S3J3H4_LINAN|nr:uncharacterized protein LOC106169864 [Lingula anatina]|eukprot:XP_013404950.1 uncharacterized protein LOC106169864 [Lingula anatina]